MHANMPVTAFADAPPPRPSPACRDGLDAETMRAMAAMAITARPDAARGEEDMTAETASVAPRLRHAVGGGGGGARLLRAAMAAATDNDAAKMRRRKRPRTDDDGNKTQQAEADDGAADGGGGGGGATQLGMVSGEDGEVKHRKRPRIREAAGQDREGEDR